MRSAERDCIFRGDETCERERDESSAGSQVSALNDDKGKQSDKAGGVHAASAGPERSSRANNIRND